MISSAPPPHPRGSTRRAARAEGTAAPSPAPAGIHPPFTVAYSPGRSLPRTRGDPPRICRNRSSRFVPPPHPRGSTLGAGQRHGGEGPSPAPAGIHPTCRAIARSTASLPRTRGDPPRSAAGSWPGCCPPPHPRGSTPTDRGPRRRLVPSPAPAGIHPAHHRSRRCRDALPRTRGDPPIILPDSLPSSAPPPHPRGSTPCRRREALPELPSPAPAGIHPTLPVALRPKWSLPRTRGDPPYHKGLSLLHIGPPPHPRGSTRGYRTSARSTDPSPAPAGIHPDFEADAAIIIPLPRTRGDPPWMLVMKGRFMCPPPHPRGSTRADRRLPERL